MTRGRANRGATVAVAVAVLAVLGPLLWVIRVALKPAEAYLSDPAGLGGGVTLANFADAWNIGGLGAAVVNSLIVVIPGALLATGLATLAGWGLARYLFPGRGVLAAILVAAMFLPLAALVMPLFELGLDYDLVGRQWWLAVVYGTVFAPWATLFLRSILAELPGEIMEAASVDGAGPLTTFWSVALPMAKPALATAFILNVFLQWSELIVALLLLPAGDQQMVTVAIAQFSTQFRTGGPLTAAGLLIGAVPILAVFAVGQRWLRAGALSGAVKD